MPATLWWRDDDARLPSPHLDRLIELSAASATPLVLAAIPHEIDSSLKHTIQTGPHISIVQHGWSHSNHAPANEKKCELGNHRDLNEILQELSAGAEILASFFANRFLPVLVPPWNRISITVASHLQSCGYIGLSRFGTAAIPRLPADFYQANTHVDLVDWRGTRGFTGTETALHQITSHLQHRRNGQVPRDQATGILSHHLVHDEELWQFLALLFQFTGQHQAPRWLSGREVFTGSSSSR